MKRQKARRHQITKYNHPSTTKQADNKQQTKTINSSTDKQKNAEPKKRTVKISIRVDTLLKHWEKLDSSLQSETSRCIILKTTTYELLSEKDTVWDVLQRATKEHKIQMEYQGANENIYNSVYVEGINHLYEFSAGELSGWMYKKKWCLSKLWLQSIRIKRWRCHSMELHGRFRSRPRTSLGW
ncbi:hypothetical protein LSPH24S_10233 [Lysinibacillus sphaericus]